MRVCRCVSMYVWGCEYVNVLGEGSRSSISNPVVLTGTR